MGRGALHRARGRPGVLDPAAGPRRGVQQRRRRAQGVACEAGRPRRLRDRPAPRGAAVGAGAVGGRALPARAALRLRDGGGPRAGVPVPLPLVVGAAVSPAGLSRLLPPAGARAVRAVGLLLARRAARRRAVAMADGGAREPRPRVAADALRRDVLRAHVDGAAALRRLRAGGAAAPAALREAACRGGLARRRRALDARRVVVPARGSRPAGGDSVWSRG